MFRYDIMSFSLSRFVYSFIVAAIDFFACLRNTLPPSNQTHYLTVLLHLIFFYLSVILRSLEAMTDLNLIRFSNVEKPTAVNLENYNL